MENYIVKALFFVMFVQLAFFVAALHYLTLKWWHGREDAMWKSLKFSAWGFFCFYALALLIMPFLTEGLTQTALSGMLMGSLGLFLNHHANRLRKELKAEKPTQ